MELSENYLADLTYYLEGLKQIFPKLPLEKKMYKEGTTVGQIFYHTTQVVNSWFRINVLEGEYPRNRELEFKNQPTRKEMQSSLEKALEICHELPKHKLKLNKRIAKPITISSNNFVIDNVNTVLFHITVHTAEHWGELHLLVDK